jgi:hypothetical protein
MSRDHDNVNKLTESTYKVSRLFVRLCYHHSSQFLHLYNNMVSVWPMSIIAFGNSSRLQLASGLGHNQLLL